MDVLQYAQAGVSSVDLADQRIFYIYRMRMGVLQYAHVDVASDYKVY